MTWICTLTQHTVIWHTPFTDSLYLPECSTVHGVCAYKFYISTSAYILLICPPSCFTFTDITQCSVSHISHAHAHTCTHAHTNVKAHTPPLLQAILYGMTGYGILYSRTCILAYNIHWSWACWNLRPCVVVRQSPAWYNARNFNFVIRLDSPIDGTAYGYMCHRKLLNTVYMKKIRNIRAKKANRKDNLFVLSVTKTDNSSNICRDIAKYYSKGCCEEVQSGRWTMPLVWSLPPQCCRYNRPMYFSVIPCVAPESFVSPEDFRRRI